MRPRTPDEIRKQAARLAKAGHRVKDIAAKLGLKPHHTSRIIGQEIGNRFRNRSRAGENSKPQPASREELADAAFKAEMLTGGAQKLVASLRKKGAGIRYSGERRAA
jgi:hypothetical protein